MMKLVRTVIGKFNIFSVRNINTNYNNNNIMGDKNLLLIKNTTADIVPYNPHTIVNMEKMCVCCNKKFILTRNLIRHSKKCFFKQL
jgi:hypothetical protein